ncbi:MAG TPA: PepSY domain-containing protein [Acidobacteriaceae bacterium]
MAKSSTIKTFRLVHRYLGLFFAPAILFFAFSGALQTFNWHEASRATGYEPPAWVVRMAQLHKKQTLALPSPKGKAQTVSAKEPGMLPSKKAPSHNTGKFVFKCFVFVMSIGLMFSTILGIAMALLYGGDSRTVWTAVFAGVLLPAALLLLRP